jgi:tripartite-type tricarboxylate transporter receptor subunit TctC
MKTRLLRYAVCAGLASGTAFLDNPAQAASVADFYKGKDIKLVVGSDPGGGYDVYARALARHFTKHLPGKPNIIVQNMQGAGGVVATNWLYNIAPKDGTVFGMPQRGTPFLAFFGKPGPKFDPVKFNWIGSLNNETGVITLWHTAKVKTLQDAMEQVSLIGGSGPNDTESYPALMDNTIGTKFRIISGYPSTTAISLAMERGEVDGLSQSWSSLKSEHPDWVKNKTLSILVQISNVKHPDLPNVPTVMEFVKNPEHKAIWNIMLAQKAMGRPFTAPPGVPKDRVNALRAAFDATVKDPAFIADIGKQGRELTPVSGKEVQAMLQEIAAQPKSLLAKVDDYITYKGKKEMVKIKSVENTGKITKVEGGGREIAVKAGGKEVTTKISGSRTKLMLDGKKAKRDQLQVGMNCTVTAPAGSDEAAKVDCHSGK